ncbi:phage tail protein [Streptomyces sp. NPDC051320]|uniref:phage tail protein n=1 Tax=Streptomyces sp. NPDC051320 TaxID=3154644 RepID=UPI00341F57F0
MRGSVDGLGSSAPLGMMLPAVFADDDLAQRFVAGLDEVLAPIHNVLDCLDAYFTPSLAPADFTRWLGDWVGAETDVADRPGLDDDGDAVLRTAVAAAAHLHRIRGTRRGLEEAIRLAFGVDPEITESGAAGWDARPLGPVPGDRRPHLHVSLALPDPGPTDQHRLESLVAAARPAHMPYTVQVTAAERTPGR